jgi:hypothetical protein
VVTPYRMRTLRRRSRGTKPARRRIGRVLFELVAARLTLVEAYARQLLREQRTEAAR